MNDGVPIEDKLDNGVGNVRLELARHEILTPFKILGWETLTSSLPAKGGGDRESRPH